jgi:hypothetical protein
MKRKKRPVLPSDSRWTVINEAGRSRLGKTLYRVQCSCSSRTIKVVLGHSLSGGQSRSCGCLVKETTSIRSKKHPILPPDSRWIILGEAGKNKWGQWLYHVRCSCPLDITRIIMGSDLTDGVSKSCGCLKRETTSIRSKKYPILPPDSRWIILGETGRYNHKQVTYHVRCSCDSDVRKIIIGSDLTKGHSKSCGCLHREALSLRRKWPILPEGSRWTILGETGRSKRGSVTYLVQCSCPSKTVKTVVGSLLTYGRPKSCGCLRNERVRIACKKKLKMHNLIEQFGHLINIEKTIENIQQEIKNDE